MNRYCWRVLCCCLLAATSARAADDGIAACTGIADATSRLACYDRAAGYQAAERASETARPAERPPAAADSEAAAAASAGSSAGSFLGRMWELSGSAKNGTFRFRPYQPNYFMFWRHSSRPNAQPFSPSRGTAAAPPLQASETRFQLSFKTKLWEGIFHSPLDMWFGYTQQSNWQLYNTVQSSPVRETNYEPELILTLPVEIELPGMHWKMLNAGFVHQSNGQAGAGSRSWNRIYLQAGFERGNVLLMLRPWYHLPVSAGRDDNPDIRQFMGSGDVRLAWIGHEHALTALGRFSFQGRKGALKLNWIFPIRGRLKGYAEYFNGYGETLVDYNHSQQIIGLGLLLSTWP